MNPLTRAIVLCPRVKNQPIVRPDARRIEEAVGLAQAIDLEVADSRAVVLSRVRPSHLLGSGIIEELKPIIADQHITLLIIDGVVSPVQQRNLEKELNVKVLDRTGLILEIFGRRARTHEGKLQVELAALSYQRGRLVRSWTHLERQRGGFGFLGGPGESQLEMDRRLLDTRIERIKKDLADVRRTRGLHRRRRTDVPYPLVALVGYTNAGKSTLFNRLSGAAVAAKDMLFATLDPTVRAVRLANGQTVMLSDTVGFIADLPTQLVEAFNATLEEVLAADIILHVRDISHPETDAQKDSVLGVLRDIGLTDAELEDNVIEVWNKIDCLPEPVVPPPGVVAVSALTGAGIAALLEAMTQRHQADWLLYTVHIPHGDGAARAWLAAHGEVVETDGEELTVRLEAPAAARFHKRFGGYDLLLQG
ncbi:MAG: GTPase HflX [Holosporales bacterium]